MRSFGSQDLTLTNLQCFRPCKETISTQSTYFYGLCVIIGIKEFTKRAETLFLFIKNMPMFYTATASFIDKDPVYACQALRITKYYSKNMAEALPS